MKLIPLFAAIALFSVHAQAASYICVTSPEVANVQYILTYKDSDSGQNLVNWAIRYENDRATHALNPAPSIRATPMTFVGTEQNEIRLVAGGKIMLKAPMIGYSQYSDHAIEIKARPISPRAELNSPALTFDGKAVSTVNIAECGRD